MLFNRIRRMPYTLVSGVIGKNMCKHQLAITKASANIPSGVMLQFLGTYYGSFRDGIEDMFELSLPINPFENDDVYDPKY